MVFEASKVNQAHQVLSFLALKENRVGRVDAAQAVHAAVLVQEVNVVQRVKKVELVPQV